jgi:DNA-binding NtrC family response regulator
LLYRLNVFHIDVPPLRDRGDDLLLLAHHFMRLFGSQLGKPLIGIEREAEHALMQYDYPGNVR